MRWPLQIADHFLHFILTDSYTEGNYLILILYRLRDFFPQNLRPAGRNRSTDFEALPSASSIYAPDLTPLGNLTSSLNRLTSAYSPLPVPIPFNGGDSIPTQAYYVLW